MALGIVTFQLFGQRYLGEHGKFVARPVAATKSKPTVSDLADDFPLKLKEVVGDYERALLQRSLEHAQFNQRKARLERGPPHQVSNRGIVVVGRKLLGCFGLQF